MMAASRAVLIILDGFGIGKDSPFNAIKNAEMPFYRNLILKYPTSELLTHGGAVGLPDGVMGNSEVGHMTMGAGRVIYQDLTRISKAIREGEFFRNSALRRTIESGAANTGRVHLMGLLSDGGVHSHIDHLFALLDLCREIGVPHVSVHAFLDGRDTPPDSSFRYLSDLFQHPSFKCDKSSATQVTLATISGRYWAMDRDQRWERIAKTYFALTGQIPMNGQDGAIASVKNSHDRGKTDEFVEPILLDPAATMKDGDAVIFFNFRADRARELSRAIATTDFSAFDRGKGFKPSMFTGMTVYDRKLVSVDAAFSQQNLSNIMGEWLERRNLCQFRIAETEKYAHVTFFFNGGRETPFRSEDRLLIPSPKDVATYDLKPEMSADAVAQEAAKRIDGGSYHFILMNFANADMVGHTGNYEAAVRAMETLDRCLAQVIGTAQRSDYHVLLTADHGNAEEMRDSRGKVHTQHTLNPVPAIWVSPNSAIAPRSTRVPLNPGSLQDVMPTLCELMKLPIPDEVTGKSLLPKGILC